MNLLAVILQDALYDVETQAQPGGRFFEFFKEVGQILGRDTRTLITHNDRNESCFGTQLHLDMAGVVQGIGDVLTGGKASHQGGTPKKNSGTEVPMTPKVVQL